MSRSTPSIHISLHSKQPIDNSPSPSIPIAGPMAIPHSREAVPPPLPPPQFIPEISPGRDPGWQWANDPSSSDYGRAASVKPGSSLLGGSRCGALSQERHVGEHARKASSTSTITPPSRDVEMEDRPPAAEENLSRIAEHGLRSERKLGRSAWEDASQAYDKHLVSRIGGPNTPHRASLSGSSIQDVSERERRNSLLPALSLSHESTRYMLPSMSPSGAISNTWEGPRHTRHSSSQSERHENQRQYPQQQQEDSAMEDAVREVPSGNFRLGAKRRASSPPRELQDRSAVAGGQRPPDKDTSTSSTAAPTPRYHATHASLSSVSSFGGQPHGSLGSSLGPPSLSSSAATSYASGILSPPAASTSTAVDNDLSGASPSEVTSEATTHSRTASDLDNRLHSNSRAHFGVYLCECCPKKPKRFETAEELRAHEAEKQYGCAYCSNRFKNKNEAERHQNSLHLRRHSWSCAALANQEAAFHPSSGNPEKDACGYCGEEFSNPPDWKERTQHLTVNHKFGQCNQTKKFFRADHFRQHLKHSHDSTSGKWTNMLENACMRDEPPPPPSRSGSDSSTLYPTSSDYASPRSQ